MTIDDLIPDKELNLGGRPPKNDEKEKEKEETFVWLPDKDSKEFWDDLMNNLAIHTITENVYNDERIGSTAISKLADITYLSPWQVREQLEEYDIYETDWDNAPDDYPPRYRTEEKDDVPQSGAFANLIKDRNE